MIYRLRFCNKDGVEARVDIQKGSATPVIDVEGTDNPFTLSYNNDKGNKSGMFLTSSADIEIYETEGFNTEDFNIDNLKTSNETELAVTYYINDVVKWKGFIIPDFFSIEVRSNPVIVMTASDRLGTIKSVTLSDLPSMISLRELAVSCLNKTGLELPLKTMADFNSGTGTNDFFNSKILTQRLSDTKGRSISCYDILSSILTASNSKLLQRGGEWVIINKVQHEAGSGKLFSSATSFINWSDVIFNFSDISIGGRRTIIPVASSVGVYHEHGGCRFHPENFDFSKDAVGSTTVTGWTSVNGFSALIKNEEVKSYPGGQTEPDYGDATIKNYLLNVNANPGYALSDVNYDTSPYLISDPIPLSYSNTTSAKITVDVNATGRMNTNVEFMVMAVKGTTRKVMTTSGSFEPYQNTKYHQTIFLGFRDAELDDAVSEPKRLSANLEDDNLSGYNIFIRIYGSGLTAHTMINFINVQFESASEIPNGTIYKTEKGDNFTKAHDIDTSLFGDYLTTGLNGYFYKYPIDDTSSLYNSSNELTSKWTAYNDPEQLPLLQHITRQKSRLFSVAHDLLSAEIEVNNFDPLAIFVACSKRYTVVSAQFDFFKSNLSVELEEVAFQNATVRDFIYSYFGDGESGIKSIGGISGGAGGGTGGGLTPEQIEILSWWKKDPDRENTIFTEMNAYSKLELSAYGAGDGAGGGGGSDYERLDTWADYDSTKAGWVLSAFLGNDLNTRVTAIDDRVTDLENSSGGGGVQLGETSSTAYRGDRGKTAYDHSQLTGNPHGTTFAQIVSRPTTITGYGITDAYTKTEVNSALTSKLDKSVFDDLFEKVEVSTGVFAIKAKYNFYGVGEISAYGLGTGVSGGGSYDRLDTWASYDSTKSGWVLSALLGVDLNTRVGNLEGGSALTVNTTGTGNAITSISKAGTVITATKGLTFSLDGHTHSFESLTSKPTTLAGYGISDAVTLNTAQTIIGSKIFTSSIDVDSSSYASYVAYRLSGITRGETGYATNHGGVFLRNNTANVNLVIRDDGKIVAGGDITAPTFSGALTGNAASSTKLQTARTIWGQSFDGTGNVSGALSGATTIAASTSVTTPKVIFNSAGWSMEQVGSELQLKHNNVLKMRFTSTGSIVATNEITAFG